MTRADEPMTDSAATTPESSKAAAATATTAPPRGTLSHVRRPVPRSRPYLRLLWFIPAAAILAVGIWAYVNVPAGGRVTGVRVMTKQGPVGQASEAVRNVIGTYDLYLKIKTKDGWIETDIYKNLAIGNGRTWELPRVYQLGDVLTVDVWDNNWTKDKNLDHINLGDQWAAEGQLFRVELQGRANEPPRWALPTLSVGATLTALVLLRFVWDQVV